MRPWVRELGSRRWRSGLGLRITQAVGLGWYGAAPLALGVEAGAYWEGAAPGRLAWDVV